MIGILALQGAFAEHSKMFDRIGEDSFEIRKRSDLGREIDGIVIPGGESTVIRKLLIESDMMDTVRKMIRSGLPAFGTCAGAILLAENVIGGEAGIGTMPIAVLRNAYGRQLGSFFAESEFCGKTIPMRFIRAPVITNVGDGTEILAEFDGRITAAMCGNQLATVFHPELTDDDTVHKLFMRMCR